MLVFIFLKYMYTTDISGALIKIARIGLTLRLTEVFFLEKCFSENGKIS